MKHGTENNLDGNNRDRDYNNAKDEFYSDDNKGSTRNIKDKTNGYQKEDISNQEHSSRSRHRTKGIRRRSKSRSIGSRESLKHSTSSRKGRAISSHSRRKSVSHSRSRNRSRSRKHSQTRSNSNRDSRRRYSSSNDSLNTASKYKHPHSKRSRSHSLKRHQRDNSSTSNGRRIVEPSYSDASGKMITTLRNLLGRKTGLLKTTPVLAKVDMSSRSTNTVQQVALSELQLTRSSGHLVTTEGRPVRVVDVTGRRGELAVKAPRNDERHPWYGYQEQARGAPRVRTYTDTDRQKRLRRQLREIADEQFSVDNRRIANDEDGRYTYDGNYRSDTMKGTYEEDGEEEKAKPKIVMKKIIKYTKDKSLKMNYKNEKEVDGKHKTPKVNFFEVNFV